jgi:hypothetical protein
MVEVRRLCYSLFGFERVRGACMLILPGLSVH